MPVNPDIPLLASDLKARIIPWSHTNLGIVSQFYDKGRWLIGDENAWYLQPCFAALAATMYRFDNTLSDYRDIALETLEASFKWNLGTPVVTAPRYVYNATTNYPQSLFVGLPATNKAIKNFDGGPWGMPDPVGSDENGTIEAGATFCWIIDELYEGGGIDLPHAKAYVTKLKTAADWLIDWNGNPTWYTNGNYVAHQLLFYGHLALLCRKFNDESGWYRYNQAYEQTIQTLIYPFGNNPPANAQWAEYGYTVTVPGQGSSGTGTGPTHAALLTATGGTSDGSTETGHLTETPGHSVITPGVTNTFDGAYSQLTLDLLCTIWVVNRDWRINYLMNAYWNRLETITNFSTYLIDCTGGSRQGGIRGWTGGYQYVIALLGRRANNRTNFTNTHMRNIWDQQLAANLTGNGNNAVNQIQPSTARQYRIAIATTLHACYIAAPKLT